MPAPAFAAKPVLHFSDLTWGPKTGWENSATRGAAVTVWGRNFGSTRGTSYVTVNGARLTADADYAEWGGSGPARGLERITFWLNANCADGTGSMTLTVNGVTSNALAFTVSQGTIYFVSPNGSNSNNGLHSTAQGGTNGPFRDVYMFSPNHNPSGDGQYIVYVRSGTYNTEDPVGDRTLISLRGPTGAATKQKALVGYPAETPVLNLSSTSRAAIWNADYSTGTRVYGRNSYLTYSRLAFSNGTEAIYCYGDYIRVIGNSFQDMMDPTWSGVIFMANSRYNRVYGNYFDHSGALTDGSYKHHVYMITQKLSENVTTQYDYVGWNEFSNAQAGSDNRGGVVFARTSSDASEATNHLYIHDNYFHDGNQNFIEIGDGPGQTDIFIYNNVFTGGSSTNASVAIRWTTTNANLFNNTFYRAGAGGVAPVGVDGYPRGSQLNSKNNIFYGSPGQPFFAVDYSSSLVSDHDLFYAAGNFSVPSGARITVTNALKLDPQLADPAAGNFRLLSTSPAIDAGTSTVNGTVTGDQDGIPRPQGSGYDLGAFEYFTPGSSTPPAVLAVVNAASFAAGPVAPGGMVAIFGLNLGPNDPVSGGFVGNGFTTTLAGTTVYFDGMPAPLLAVSAGQVNAVVPYFVNGKASVQVEIDVNGRRSDPLVLDVAPTAPGVFAMDSSGQGQAVVVNQDGSLNSEANPAPPGTIVYFYAAGLGQTDPPGIDGSPVTNPFPQPLADVSVQMDGVVAELKYAGGAPTFITGLHQVNALVPLNAAANPQTPLILTAAGKQSQPEITLAVGTPAVVPAASAASRPAAARAGK